MYFSKAQMLVTKLWFWWWSIYKAAGDSPKISCSCDQ